ncbi:MAG: MFS transporter, partial [Anaerotardibacter sp.]
NPKTRLPQIIIVASLIVGVSAFIAGFIPQDNFFLFVITIGVLAIACAWFNAPLMTLLQKNISEEKLGRVMGLFTAMTGLAIPVGTAVGGVIAEITGTPLFFTLDGLFIILIGLGVALSKEVRKLSR